MGSAAINYEIEAPDKKAQFEIEPPKPPESTVVGSVKKGLSNVFYEGPKSLYHAFSDPAQPGEYDVSGAPWERGARAFNRIFVDPSLRTQEKAAQATNPVQKAGYYGASALPGSEWIAAKGEQAGRGDIKGAAIETATTLAAPHIAGAVLRNAVPLARSAKTIATPPARMALEAAKDIPVVRGAVKGATAFKDVPAQLRNIWNPQPGTPGVDIPGGVPPTGPNPEPISTPYRLAGEAVPAARTATPRTIAPLNRQLRAAPPEGLPAPEAAAPAPYRMRGAQIPEPATATPRTITPVSRQLPAPRTTGEVAPQPRMGAPAQPPAATQPLTWPPERPSVIERPKFGGKADLAEDRALQEQMREDLEKHGRSAYSQEKRDWFARNQPGSSKGELAEQFKGEAGVPSPAGVQLGKPGPHINDYTGEPIPDSPMIQHEIIKNGKVWGKVRVNPASGEVTVNPEIPPGVENPAEFAQTKRGELGVRGIKKLMGDLKEQYPGMEEVSGKKANIRSNPGSTQRIKLKPMSEGSGLIEGLKQMKARKK